MKSQAALSRDVLRSARKREVRGTTLPERMPIMRLRILREENERDYPKGVQRPARRGDCVLVPRPCPWVSCKWHLYLDVTATGGVKLNFPDLEVWEVGESCALDVANRGGQTLETTAALLNITRERLRQIEERAAKALAGRMGLVLEAAE